MEDLSPHLKLKELGCKDGTPYPEKWLADRAMPLAQVFETIREIYGRPIKVLSAYRTPTHNAKVGGARNSQHVQGRALDLAPPTGVSVEQFGKAIRQLSIEQPGLIGGIGYYPTFVHVDIRPEKKHRVAQWHGGRPLAELPSRPS